MCEKNMCGICVKIQHFRAVFFHGFFPGFFHSGFHSIFLSGTAEPRATATLDFKGRLSRLHALNPAGQPMELAGSLTVAAGWLPACWPASG